MGISFSHCGFGTSHSGFQSMRERLALAADIDVGNVNSGGPLLEDEFQADPLFHFLKLSDSANGPSSLAPKFCGPIANRIRELVMDWSDAPAGYLGTKGMFLEIANGLDEASSKKEFFRVI